MLSSSRKCISTTLFSGFHSNHYERYHTTTRLLIERNYYDVLNVKKTCSTKDIRESFIYLAKKHHPDTNPNDAGSHTRFVELQKAYSVLSVPWKRSEYDLRVSGMSSNSTKTRWKETTEDLNQQRYHDEFNSYFYRKGYNPSAHPTSVKHVGLLRIMWLLFIFTSVGATIQFFVIRWIYRRNYLYEMERHRRGSDAFYALKDQMDKQGEEYDMDKLRKTYYQQMGDGAIALRLIPPIIRPNVPNSSESHNNLTKPATKQDHQTENKTSD